MNAPTHCSQQKSQTEQQSNTDFLSTHVHLICLVLLCQSFGLIFAVLPHFLLHSSALYNRVTESLTCQDQLCLNTNSHRSIHPLQQDCAHLDVEFLKANSDAHAQSLKTLVPPSSSSQAPLLPNRHTPLIFSPCSSYEANIT